MVTGTPRVEIVQLDPATLAALGRGDLAAARAASGLDLTPAFVDPTWCGTWTYRSEQVRDDPEAQAWVTGAVRDAGTGAFVGRAGFHGPPDGAGLVEVGYAVDPVLRRRGWGRAALEAMLDRARSDPRVRVVRASVAPDNVASQRVVAPYGFVRVGEQWDEEDGLEEVWEVVLDRPAGDHPESDGPVGAPR